MTLVSFWGFLDRSVGIFNVNVGSYKENVITFSEIGIKSDTFVPSLFTTGFKVAYGSSY